MTQQAILFSLSTALTPLPPSHLSKDVEAGYQLLLSYGERSNDDFFLHYGERQGRRAEC